MSAGTAYSKRYGAGFVDLPTQSTPVDQQFLNAVETVLLQLIGQAPTVDGQVAQWDFANTRFGPALLLNKNIDAAAAIAKSKLDLTGANGIVDADVSGVAAIAQSKINGLAASLAAAGLPTGAVVQYAGAAAPSGFVLGDGASYLRADGVHDTLFAIIGTTYGAADGTHFNVPDLRGRVPVGLGTNASVSALNTNDGQAVANRRPHHRTTQALGASVTDPGHFHSTPLVSAGSGAGAANLAEGDTQAAPVSDGSAVSDTKTTGIGVSITGSIGTNNGNDAIDVPSFIVVNYIIKL